MANTPQARKRVRQNEIRRQRNHARMSRIRTFVKQVETAIASGDKASAETALREAQPEIMTGVSKGVMHKNTASRKVSRLARRVRDMVPA
ncbi:30S ribosomal protein S20 [Rhodothalassium salexigens]|uniref:Small ribosomal subunit protein bS20 n=1 Tax=Rhodothalassium salexigens DSM 2132 TaxID=1188247 RepID=A0A4R2PMZ1_RHOSA|nr:30S ribosomal protein S20 [Rhodothalassium salexigens]MBB4211060.1 small subunit ribosomal protein S20 [Rhodothalassium salexigens DSM 2132]MBK1637937.1 30S ribosomal protein S20 [Rhodothalassium salexigens DSM 2132]MBK5912138.1 30S ribosomal protein S20 [Rhodothalassium salexigens]MBK5921818.1 30S ribosomal protein S20 [Rhodothalassium salexigens]TCP36284.1 SSU ribosomal protein S20P [Rhodothalassium salexigens DSM 2132]